MFYYDVWSNATRKRHAVCYISYLKKPLGKGRVYVLLVVLFLSLGLWKEICVIIFILVLIYNIDICFVTKCPFGNSLFSWIWIFFAESVENKLKNKLNNTVGPMNSIKSLVGLWIVVKIS